MPGTRSVPAGAFGRRVDGHVPVHIADGIDLGLDPPKQPLPGAVRRPAAMPLVNGLPGAVPVRQVTPLHARPDPVQHPVDHLPMIPPPATAAVAHRQQRLEPLPLGIRQITSMSHSPMNGLPDRQDTAWKGVFGVAPDAPCRDGRAVVPGVAVLDRLTAAVVMVVAAALGRVAGLGDKAVARAAALPQSRGSA
jgi:hypothetical protein